MPNETYQTINYRNHTIKVQTIGVFVYYYDNKLTKVDDVEKAIAFIDNRLDNQYL